MSSMPNVHVKDPTAVAYQDAVETLRTTQEACQRLAKWATNEFADPYISLPVCDLAQYCEATIQHCNSYIAHRRLLLQSEFVREQVWRGLDALGLETNAISSEHSGKILDVLIAECKRRTLEVLDLLDKRITQIPREEKLDQKYKQTKSQQAHDYQRVITAVKAAHGNHIASGKSLYMLEKRQRTENEVAEHILPQMSAFGNGLSVFSENSNSDEPFTEDQFPEKPRVEEITQKLLFLSADWAECLRKITDPLNLQSYKSRSDVPYKEVAGVAAGSGSFGIVYKAENTNTGTVIAIKQLSGIYTSSSQDTVRKELSMLEICDHPNIVKLLDAYQIDDHPHIFYLVMEPWAPYTLSAFLHQSDLQRHHDSPWFIQGNHDTERQVIRIFRGLADGLSYLHAKFIKHKDLKPENILLYDDSPRGIRPIIADLGISKVFKHGNPTDFNRSTYAYLAPEQINRTGSTLRSDVWQLGCCFALILAVFRKGSGGCRQLWNSFENSDRDCSRSIALEAPTFMETFKNLCGDGSVSQLRAYRVVTAMLEIEPNLRFDIKMVKRKLADLEIA